MDLLLLSVLSLLLGVDEKCKCEGRRMTSVTVKSVSPERKRFYYTSAEKKKPQSFTTLINLK